MQRIDFITKDNVYLHGILYDAPSKEKVIIAVHGMGSDVFRDRKAAIAQKASEKQISYFCFNNRGHDFVNYIKRKKDGKLKDELCGSAYEDVLDSYYDILGAVQKMIELGYKNIYLQGHSLGCTKIVYTYNKMMQENNQVLEKIKAIALLSFLDMPSLFKIYLGERYLEKLEYAENQENVKYAMMPFDSFVNPISVKTFLRYNKYNEEIDFAKHGEKEYNYEKLNNIKVPLFMRWGNNNEFIQIPADKLSKKISEKLDNKNKDVGFIDGADHHYTGKENKMAEELIAFIDKN